MKAHRQFAVARRTSKKKRDPQRPCDRKFVPRTRQEGSHYSILRNSHVSMIFKPLVLLFCALFASSAPPTPKWDATRTACIGPDAPTCRVNVKVKTVEQLFKVLKAHAGDKIKELGKAVGEVSYYAGFATTPKCANNCLNRHHYATDNAFRYMENHATQWHEIRIRYVGPSLKEIYIPISKSACALARAPW